MPRFVMLSLLSTALILLGLFIEQNSAAELSPDSDVRCQQYPRFTAIRRGRCVNLYCSCNKFCSSMEIHQIDWYLGTENSSILQNLTNNPNFQVERNLSWKSSTLTIKKVQKKDSGIYFCRFITSEKKQWTTCGTELKVLGVRRLQNLKMRNTLKDAIIMIQTVLIVLFVSVPVLLIIDKNTRSDPMEEDHTYEGLEIEQAPMYEDIVTLRAVESKWNAAEHPCLE